ncbi:V-type proton ATPase subunit G-like [Zingiber officinale]|uniref:V-type proton ATPase subunit G-like n=1 Tax=Zingiber officinale TaxID=94328 RepID=UPI001C4AB68F|nr:V-type proton ATPase subunit G-like [Zingiber officinale]
MDSVRGQRGIHMLLAAEQEAQEIISKARNMKTARLKQAKDEAEWEATAYRASLEEDYKRKASGSSGWNVKKLDEETEIKIQNLKDASSKVHGDVISMLLKHVTSV